jgi:hypothetical protein
MSAGHGLRAKSSTVESSPRVCRTTTLRGFALPGCAPNVLQLRGHVWSIRRDSGAPRAPTIPRSSKAASSIAV